MLSEKGTCCCILYCQGSRRAVRECRQFAVSKVRFLSFDKGKVFEGACVAVLDVSNKAVLNSLTITDSNCLPQASISNHVRVVILFAYNILNKGISCKLKRATRTPYNLWSCYRLLYFHLLQYNLTLSTICKRYSAIGCLFSEVGNRLLQICLQLFCGLTFYAKTVVIGFAFLLAFRAFILFIFIS